MHLEQLLLQQRRRHVLRLLLQLRRQVRHRVLLLLLRRLLLLLLLRRVLRVGLLAVLPILRRHATGRLAHVGRWLHHRVLHDRIMATA